VVVSCTIASAQETITKTDSAQTKNDTTKKVAPKESEFALSSKVVYKACDSIRFDIDAQKVYLYGKSRIDYEEITLTADYIEISFKINQLFAKGLADSTGKINGTPVFTQGTETFTANTLTYNFKTKKGLIKDIVTKEGDSYIQGITVKKFPDNSINIRNGLYTTCDLPHPHYEIKFSKARIIPDDKIVTGPAYLVIEDVPTPLAVPFGFFPNKKGQKSGILFPSYGESANRGFFLENGGYYFGLGQYMDLALRGDIYSHGSWAVRTSSNYVKKYRYSGVFGLGYAINLLGNKGTPDFSKNSSFYIRWTHNQDIKAHPNSRFSANVNIASSKYNTFNPSSTQDYLTNTLTSNISYSTTIASNYNFSVNMRHSQNTLTRALSLNLPEIAFSVNRFYPFKREKIMGKPKWYDNISVGYSMNAENNINTIDTLLFPKNAAFSFNRLNGMMENGMKHNIPVSSSIKVLKNFSWTNSLNYNERWYLQSIEKHWVSDSLILNNDTTIGYLRTDTIQGFKTARDFSFSSSLSTRLYGMYNFKNMKLIAIRHVITPSVSFVYMPDFGAPAWGYYRYYTNYDKPIPQQTRYYSIFESGIYGSPPTGKASFINMSLSNNLEMKVRSKKDTITGTRKVVLIDNFMIATGYNLAADSLKWSKISMSGRTKLFKNLDVTYASLWDPYIINDSTGINIDTLEWTKNHRLFRMVNTDWAFNLNWSLRPKQKKKEIVSDKASQEEIDMIKANADKYVDFDQPWSLNIMYTLRYMRDYNQTTKIIDKKIIQTLSFNGDLSITDKWKIGFTSGYDFQQKDFSYTSLNIYRDLHCWEMIFNWIPTGFRKSYNLTIRVKSPVLQDLKLTKKKDFRDF
jgi:hypothetical protein